MVQHPGAAGGTIAIANGSNGQATALHKDALAIAWGSSTRAKGVLGSSILCMETDKDGIHLRLRKVDGVTIKENTWYSLKNGELKEA